MLQSIYFAKKIIYNQVNREKYDEMNSGFNKYQKGFYVTNENINAYLSANDFLKKEYALSVTGSGDHVFNLAFFGFKHIDTFDINKLTEYFFALKKALIIKYEYMEYLYIINYLVSPTISLDNLINILMDLLPLMEPKHRIFWNEIFSYSYKIQKQKNNKMNLLKMLFYGATENNIFLFNNNYLYDDYNYSILRTNLKSTTIDFKNVNALNIDKKFKKNKYDALLLSNVLDYVTNEWGNNWDYEVLQNYINSLQSIMNPSGIIYLHYVFDLISFNQYTDEYFYGSNVNLEDICETIIKVPKVSNRSGFDGMILKRIKN